MKKLYKKGKVHPSPPLISDHLAFLPATILTLAAALSPQDREVLAYLLSCSGAPPTTSTSTSTSTSKKNPSLQKSVNSAEHPSLFNCNCFKCYTSYWVRWDASPNRQLIHDIIDAFEDELTQKKKMMNNNKKERKNKKRETKNQLKRFEDESTKVGNSGESESIVLMSSVPDAASSGDEGGEGEEFEKGTVRKFVSFIGETIWGVWN
ncbi:hypothetical protein ACHQM5_025598 [Ranunculus cassubicifolius]